MQKSRICRWCYRQFEPSKHGYEDSCVTCKKKWKQINNYEWRQKNKGYHKKYLRKWRKDCAEMERALL